jgi:hypothetical protein
MAKRGKKTRKKRLYFTQEHEDAIVEYCRTEDMRTRTILYETLIGPAFDEMVKKIIYTYKFNTLPNIDSLEDECKFWLVTILYKFDPDKGHKAFSYFSVITKNWFIHKVKKNSKRRRAEVYLDDLRMVDESLVTKNTYIEQRIANEFWNILNDAVNKWSDEDLKEQEQRLLSAIRVLLDNKDKIEIFNKKAIYLYIREISGLNSKQITAGLQKIRVRYRALRKDWNEGKL